MRTRTVRIALESSTTIARTPTTSSRQRKTRPQTRAAAEREIGGCPGALEQGPVRGASEYRTVRRAGRRVPRVQRLRVGIVGSGFAANLHADAWQRVSGIDVSIVAVAAGHPHTAAAFAGRH